MNYWTLVVVVFLAPHFEPVVLSRTAYLTEKDCTRAMVKAMNETGGEADEDGAILSVECLPPRGWRKG